MNMGIIILDGDVAVVLWIQAAGIGHELRVLCLRFGRSANCCTINIAGNGKLSIFNWLERRQRSGTATKIAQKGNQGNAMSSVSVWMRTSALVLRSYRTSFGIIAWSRVRCLWSGPVGVPSMIMCHLQVQEWRTPSCPIFYLIRQNRPPV